MSHLTMLRLSVSAVGSMPQIKAWLPAHLQSTLKISLDSAVLITDRPSRVSYDSLSSIFISSNIRWPVFKGLHSLSREPGMRLC